ITRLFQASSLSALAELLTEQLQGSPTLSPVPAQLPTDVAEFELSRGQHALYYLHQLVPGIHVFNLSFLLSISLLMYVILLRRAFQKLVDRHPTLRTNFIPTPSGPLQRVRQRLEVCFLEVPAETWTREQLNDQVLQAARRRFNLEEDHLLRITIYRRRDEIWLLMLVHHIVADLWSLDLLVKELGILYSSEKSGSCALLPESAAQYHDYVQWQAEMLASPKGDQLWKYWKEKLSGELPVLELPTDRPRPLIQTYAGDC